MVKIRRRPTTEHYDFASDNRYQQSSKRSKRGNERLRVSGREGIVYLSCVYAEFVSDPVPNGIYLVHVRLSHVFFCNAR